LDTIARLAKKRATPQAFDLFWNFSYYLFRWKDKDREELERVAWESQWKFHPSDERRGRRGRLIPRDDFFVLLRDDRAGLIGTTEQCASCEKLFWDRLGFLQRGTRLDPCPKERRNPLRCKCRKEPFHDIFAHAVHLPCPLSFEIGSEGLADRIQDIRSRHEAFLYAEEKKTFHKLLDASLSETVFELACESGTFRWRNEETKKQNFQQFRTEWFAQFLARIRPKLIDAESPTVKQLEEVDRIQREYFRSRFSEQDDILCQLFFRESLSKMAKRERPGRPLSAQRDADKLAAKHILQTQRGEKAATLLRNLGYSVPTEKGKMYGWIRRTCRRFGITGRNKVKSTE